MHLIFTTTRGPSRVLSFLRWRTQGTERLRGFRLAGGRAGVPAVGPRAHVSKVNTPPERPLQGPSTAPSNSQRQPVLHDMFTVEDVVATLPCCRGAGLPEGLSHPALLSRPTRWTSSLRAACFTTWFLRAATLSASPYSDRPTSSWAPTASTAYSPRSTVSGQLGVRGKEPLLSCPDAPARGWCQLCSQGSSPGAHLWLEGLFLPHLLLEPRS